MADSDVVDKLSDFIKWLGIGGVALGWHAARKTGELMNRLEAVEERANPAVIVADHEARIKILERSLENHIQRLDDIQASVSRLEGLEEAAQTDRTEILRLLRIHIEAPSGT